MAGVEGPGMSAACCTCLTALKEQSLGPRGGAQPKGQQERKVRRRSLAGG